MNKWMFLKGLKIAVFAVLGIFLLSFLTSMLWNRLIPVLFNGPIINMCQALGLLLLGRLFFGNFGGRRGGSCGNCGTGWKGGQWRKRFEEKINNMSPEEKERLKQKCGKWYEGFSEEGKVNKDQQ